MTIKVTLPEAWQAFNAEAHKNDDVRHEQCWDVVGEPLNKPVREVVPAYYEKLELGDKRVAMSKRGEILELYWGRIEQDGAALSGLGKALASLSTMIETNVNELAAHWSGDSFEAFKTAMGKIRTTLDAYSAGAEKVAGILLEAMSQARSMYADYAEASQKALTFDWISPVEQWHKMDGESGSRLRDVCPDSMGHPCQKDEDEQKAILDGNFVTDRLWDRCAADPCDANAGRVIIMYRNLVAEANAGRDKIRARVDEWCDATDSFKEQVRSVLEVAVGNLYTLAQSQAFSSLRVVGGATGGGRPAGGEGEVTGGHPGGDSGAYPGGGAPSSEPVADPAAAPEPAPEPEPPVAEEPAAEPAEEPSAEPAAAEPVAEEPDPATVTITDGDHTIGVTNPGVEGHVKVTVTDATGATKTYDLDFDAASGLAPRSAVAPVADGVEQVPARSDGKCVIQDGDLTITAERPLFAPDQITLTVDDGDGAPARYTVDFPDVPEPVAEPTAQAQPPDGSATAEPTGEPADGGQDVAAPRGDQVAEPVAVAASSTADVNPAAEPAATPAAGGLTSPQAWTEDARGSVSGVLVPEQPDGEAGLASAPDDDKPRADAATGMAGAGLPIGGGPNAGGPEPGRAGSGWSVHGDLFAPGEPVHSMHGVLGDDEPEWTGR